METKKLSLQEMEMVEGGSKAGTVCGVVMGSWGLVLGYGASAAAMTAGASLVLSAAWLGISTGICAAVS